jgi:type VI secretion system protein ImpC
MRAILHHPDFQSLEALWRGLDLLVREYGAEDNLEIHLLDITKEELAADLKAQENLAQSALFRALQDRAWAVLLGDYTFADSVEEMETLRRIAHVAARLGGAFLAGASSRLVGCESLVTQPDPNAWLQPLAAGSREAWAALRVLPEASHLGLALPRVILRQPYGKGSDPIEAFPFEEFPGDPRHDDYLWGNGAFVCAYLLADAFRAEGWELSGTGTGELDDLPVHRFTEEGEIKVKPCAEVWLSERAADRVLSQGLMPLLSIKGRGAVRLANLQSVAQKPVAL